MLTKYSGKVLSRKEKTKQNPTNTLFHEGKLVFKLFFPVSGIGP
jgi:hypothetical protein